MVYCRLDNHDTSLGVAAQPAVSQPPLADTLWGGWLSGLSEWPNSPRSDILLPSDSKARPASRNPKCSTLEPYLPARHRKSKAKAILIARESEKYKEHKMNPSASLTQPYQLVTPNGDDISKISANNIHIGEEFSPEMLKPTMKASSLRRTYAFVQVPVGDYTREKQAFNSCEPKLYSSSANSVHGFIPITKTSVLANSHGLNFHDNTGSPEPPLMRRRHARQSLKAERGLNKAFAKLDLGNAGSGYQGDDEIF